MEAEQENKLPIYTQYKTFYSKIAGVSFGDHNFNIRRCHDGQPLYLYREPDNIYDKNAVAVMTYGQEDDNPTHVARRLGYLNKQVASTIAPLMDAGLEHACVQCTLEKLTTDEKQTHVGGNIKLEIWMR